MQYTPGEKLVQVQAWTPEYTRIANTCITVTTTVDCCAVERERQSSVVIIIWRHRRAGSAAVQR
jgi:hypothetical protein